MLIMFFIVLVFPWDTKEADLHRSRIYPAEYDVSDLGQLFLCDILFLVKRELAICKKKVNCK